MAPVGGFRAGSEGPSENAAAPARPRIRSSAKDRRAGSAATLKAANSGKYANIGIRTLSLEEVAMRKTGLRILLLLALAPTLACAPRAMRGGEGTENPNMDQPAMSTTLDKTDIEYLVSKNLDALYDSHFWKTDVDRDTQRPVFAIWPIENATSEHLEDQMLTLLSSIETSLVNSGLVQVVAKSRQAELVREIGIQQGDVYDASEAARLGKQLGAKYFMTGKLTAVDERLQKTRRLQYSLFLQIIQIETGIVEFQNETTRSKALKG